MKLLERAPTTRRAYSTVSLYQVVLISSITPFLSTMDDVDMKPTEEKKTEETKEEEKPKKVPLTPTAEIKANATLIERAVSTFEPRFTHRVLRTLTSLKKKLNAGILRSVVEDLYPAGASLNIDDLVHVLRIDTGYNLLCRLTDSSRPLGITPSCLC